MAEVGGCGFNRAMGLNLKIDLGGGIEALVSAR
jgi:hypothetical protein